jgi:ABC-type lipoprotein release transport system permease subunit
VRLGRLVFRNLRRHRRSFAFAVFGIVLGVSSLVLFLALGEGLRHNVLERVFQVDQVEVVPRRYQVGAVEMGSLFTSGTGLDDFTVEDLAAIPEVDAVYPKMQIAFPSAAAGGEALVGRNLVTELIAEGVLAELIQDELPATDDPYMAFRDWDLDRDEGPNPYTCEAPGAEGTGEAVGCPPGRACTDEGVCERLACDPPDEVLRAPSRAAANWALEAVRRHYSHRRHGAAVREVPRAALPEGVNSEFRLRVQREYAEEVRAFLPRELASWRALQVVHRSAFDAETAAIRAHARSQPDEDEDEDEADEEAREGEEADDAEADDAEAEGEGEDGQAERPRTRQRRVRPGLLDASLIPPDSRPCDAPSHCPIDRRVCEMPIPIVANPFLLEVLNTSIQNVLSGSDRRIPAMTADGLIGFEFDLRFGQGALGSATNLDDVGVSHRRARLVGWSQRSMRLGVSLPLSLVRRLNALYKGEDAANEYHSILVVAEQNEDLAGIVHHIEEELGLAIGPDYEQSKRGALMIVLLTVGLVFISGLFFLLASLNITHTFFMVITERRRELGVLRAVGARRWHIHVLVLAEAGVIGVLGALLGVGVARAGGALADRFLDCRVPSALESLCVPDFPFKPDTFFEFQPWIVGVGFGIAVLFALLGAWLPARRAARMDPAEALRST